MILSPTIAHESFSKQPFLLGLNISAIQRCRLAAATSSQAVLAHAIQSATDEVLQKKQSPCQACFKNRLPGYLRIKLQALPTNESGITWTHYLLTWQA